MIFDETNGKWQIMLNRYVLSICEEGYNHTTINSVGSIQML